MRTENSRTGLLFLLLTVVLPIPSMAQQPSLEITPYVALNLPIGVLVDDVDPRLGGNVKKRQIATLMFATRVGLAVSKRFGLEGSVGYAPGLVAVHDRTSIVDRTGRVVLASARAFLRLNPAKEAFGYHVASGVGVISRGGSAWDGTRGTTDAALVLAAGLRAGSADSPVAIKLELEDYISWAQFDDGPGQLHHDLILLIGVGITISRR